MLALDTGSAIVGPARGDIFTGSGYDAGELAGTVRNDAEFYILVPKAAAARLCASSLNGSGQFAVRTSRPLQWT